MDLGLSLCAELAALQLHRGCGSAPIALGVAHVTARAPWPVEDLRNNGVVQIAGPSRQGITEGAARVARILLQDGPTTAPALADSLGLTVQAVRRHLDQLTDEGLVAAGERPPVRPGARARPRTTSAGLLPHRGRPRRVREVVRRSGGPRSAFHGRCRWAGADRGIRPSRADGMVQRYAGSDLEGLADRMTADGYAASSRPRRGGAAVPAPLPGRPRRRRVPAVVRGGDRGDRRDPRPARDPAGHDRPRRRRVHHRGRPTSSPTHSHQEGFR